MRDNEVRAAIAAFLGAVAIMAAAIGAFLVFMGGSGDSELSAVSEHRGAPTRQEPQEDAAQLSERRDDLPPRQDSHSRGPVCADSNACRRPSPELRAAYTNPRACAGTGRRLCLVPIGDVPKDLVDHLVEYYQAEYGLSLHVVPAVELTPGSDPERPGQIEAWRLRASFPATYPTFDRDPDVVMIGLTPIDIYTNQRPEWKWFFGETYRFDGDDRPRHAIISLFRMDPVNWGEDRDDDLRNKRVRTMMNKYVALTYYGLSLNDNPRSVLYQQISSVGALDRIDERIPVPR